MRFWLLALACLAGPASGEPSWTVTPDIAFFGEKHDNAAHHRRQAEWVGRLAPSALVFEMLTPEQAEAGNSAPRDDEDALEQALGWNESGWPDFSMYYPIFAAAPEATLYGAAIPRDQARAAMTTGLASAFGEDADLFGLTTPLPEDQQATREAMQMAAHCDALPPEMLPMMVSVQRLRDAALARAALTALRETGGPVAVITGNGHARTDWGAPAALKLAAPDVAILSLGQSEDGQPPVGSFDSVEDAAAPERDDPCAAFKQGSSD